MYPSMPVLNHKHSAFMRCGRKNIEGLSLMEIASVAPSMPHGGVTLHAENIPIGISVTNFRSPSAEVFGTSGSNTKRQDKISCAQNFVCPLMPG